MSRMKKSSSMPQHPAPPIPRGAIQKLNSHLNPDSRSHSKKQDSCQTSSTGAPHSRAGASNNSHYDVPKSHAAHNSGSMDSIPRLNMDLDCADIIRETDRRLQSTPQGNEDFTVTDSEYMLPVKVEVIAGPEPVSDNRKQPAPGYKLVENELYAPEKS